MTHKVVVYSPLEDALYNSDFFPVAICVFFTWCAAAFATFCLFSLIAKLFNLNNYSPIAKYTLHFGFPVSIGLTWLFYSLLFGS